MAARKSSRVNRKYKTRYCVQNWPEYERALSTVEALRGSETGGDDRMQGSQPDVRARESEVPSDRGLTGDGEGGFRVGAGSCNNA